MKYIKKSIFLSTLSLRRATPKARKKSREPRNFYPRSPCGERLDGSGSVATSKESFLSTLSLRRATPTAVKITLKPSDFYPRSPCGERRPICGSTIWIEDISIHALLAESDFLSTAQGRRADNISIHALLAESDGVSIRCVALIMNFYPRSPCGERPVPNGNSCADADISIHALLAESDMSSDRKMHLITNFDPRSPCGERLHRIRQSREKPRHFYPRSPCGERRTQSQFLSA